MPQFIYFPRLPTGEYRAAVDSFLGALRQMPVEGEPFKAFRGRLKKADMWSRERLPHLLRFLRMGHVDPMVPSAFVRSLIDATGLDQARHRMIERLWTVNPLLFKVVLERVEERVHSPNELLKYVDSFAYPGNRISGPEVRAWVALAQGLGLFKPVGIRLGLTATAKPWLEKAHQLDIEDFLEEDEDEPVPVPPRADGARPAAAPTPTPAAPGALPSPAAPNPPAAAPPAPRPAAPAAAPAPTGAAASPSWPDPIGRNRPVPVSRFATRGAFDDDVLDTTRERIIDWWAALSDAGQAPDTRPPAAAPSPDDWMEDPPRTLFRAAVLAGLRGQPQRTPASADAAFAELDRTGVIDALHDGTAPTTTPAITDAGALMLASVIARRCAEYPDLTGELERKKTAADAFELLDGALGRGLLSIELFELMELLGAVGGVPTEGLAAFVARPDRGVRDTLYRLGFVEQPYAVEPGDLAAAAATAREAVPDERRSDVVLRAFAARAGCAYTCPRRRVCDMPCRERTDPG